MKKRKPRTKSEGLDFDGALMKYFNSEYWWCRRCKVPFTNDNKFCMCEESPSPWEPISANLYQVLSVRENECLAYKQTMEVLSKLKMDYDHPWPSESEGDKTHRESMLRAIKKSLGYYD